VNEPVMFPVTNAEQESSFSFYKRNMRVFHSLSTRNLYGQSLAQVNNLSRWLNEKTDDEVEEVLKQAKDSRCETKLKSVQDLERHMNELLAAMNVKE
jgi:hypothetical protein